MKFRKLDPSQLGEWLVLVFDGSCEPKNPGGWATYAWMLCDGDTGEELMHDYGVAARPESEWATNNHAEYSALGHGLRYLADIGWCGKLRIYGDSQLVINQLDQSWECRNPHLKKLLARCNELLKQVAKKWRAQWIPRDENGRCDGLAQKAYTEATGRPFPQRVRKSKRGEARDGERWEFHDVP